MGTSTIIPVQLGKLRKDINFLRSSIEGLRVDGVGQIKANDEFMRLWSLYEEMRQNLIRIDSSLFGELRELSKPRPKKIWDMVTTKLSSAAVFSLFIMKSRKLASI